MSAKVVAGLSLSLLIASTGSARQEKPVGLPWATHEVVEVDLRTVPFYVVDAEGNPVFDLRADEVEVLFDGEPVPIDTFDRYAADEIAPGLGTAPGAARPSRPSSVEAAGAEAEPAARHVFFYFDLAFTSPNALVRSRRVAEGLIDGLPAGDRLYLVTNHTRSGLEQRLGPIAADAAGKARMVDELRGLLPNIERLRTRPEADLPPMQPANTVSPTGGVAGNRRGEMGVPTEQVHNAYEQLGAVSRFEYREIAVDAAESLEVFAAYLASLEGPKTLLTFSSGIDRTLFFEGDVSFSGVGSSPAGNTYPVDIRRSEPLVERFRRPMTALAEAGVASLFVNAEGARAVGRDTLFALSDAAGGRYLEATADPDFLSGRILSATAAYYEAGFYASPALPASSSRVQVRVRRPGVEAWTPGRIVTRRGLREISPTERRYLLTDLVFRGAGERGAGEESALHALAGPIGARPAADGSKMLVFEPDWRALGDAEFDLYTILLGVRHGDDEMEVVRYDERRMDRASAGRIETEIPRDGAYIWGIVAVERSTGETYYRRLMLQAPQPAKAATGGGR